MSPVRRPGYTIGADLRLVEHIRRSAAYDVHTAWSASRDCLCVVKLVRADRRRSHRDRRRLLREGDLLTALAHPHIIRAYEVIRRPEPAIVLECATGATLERMLESDRLALGDTARLARQLCSAVAYLHRNGRLHLDLKPSNVTADGGYAKLLDLSIARAPGRGRRGVGTAAYCAPEQARGGALTTATDAWGIGSVLYESLAGQPPFARSRGDYPQLRQRAHPLRARRRVPRAVASVIDACLSPRPADRPRIEEIATHLAPYG